MSYEKIICPECGKNEAFKYSDSNLIICNRRNKCGYKGFDNSDLSKNDISYELSFDEECDELMKERGISDNIYLFKFSPTSEMTDVPKWVFPIYTLDQTLIGLCSYKHSPQKKYRFSSGLKKGFYFLQSFKKERKKLFIVEGIVDAITINVCFEDNVVAKLGPCLTDLQKEELKANDFDELIFVVDKDKTGIKNVLKDFKWAIENNYKVNFIFPDNKDVNDDFQKGITNWNVINVLKFKEKSDVYLDKSEKVYLNNLINTFTPIEIKKYDENERGVISLEPLFNYEFQKGRVITFVGPTNSGKTTTLLNCLYKLSLNWKCLFITYEQGSKEIATQIFKVDNLGKCNKDNIFLFERLPITQLSSVVNLHSIDIILMDYIQEVPIPKIGKNGENRFFALQWLSRYIRDFAIENDVLILTAAQIDRSCVRVRVSDKSRVVDLNENRIRECGDLANISDTIIGHCNNLGSAEEKDGIKASESIISYKCLKRRGKRFENETKEINDNWLLEDVDSSTKEYSEKFIL